MSHRVTVQSEIKEKEHAITALRKEKIDFREQGSVLHLTSGDYAGSTINLATGVITSDDVDYRKADAGKLGLLRQAYSEAKFRAEAFKTGVDIQDRQVVKISGQDVVKLRVRMA